MQAISLRTININLRYIFWGILFSLVATIVFIWALGQGAGVWEWPDLDNPIFQTIRLPRIATACLVGAALSVAGIALQGLFRNSLADAGLLGTSFGAALGVILLISLVGKVGYISLPLAAFVGGISTTGFVLIFYFLLGGGTTTLLVIGIAVGAFCGAMINLLIFISNDAIMRSALTWMMGTTADSSFTSLSLGVMMAILGFSILVFLGRNLDCLLLGEETAASLGVNFKLTQLGIAIGASLCVAAAVSLSGIIGFIGLMVPNAIRLILNANHRQLFIATACLGAVFLLAMDTLARSIWYPIDIPVGILVACTGSPFFLWLLLRQHLNKL